MPKCIPEQELQAIRVTVPAGPAGATAQQIAVGLSSNVPIRTLQYRLRHLVETGQLEREGEGRWVRYRQPDAIRAHASTDGNPVLGFPEQNPSVNCPVPNSSAKYAGILSEKGAALHRFLQQRPASRRPLADRRRLLDSYRPNVTAYLSRRDRVRLAGVGMISAVPQPPGAEALRLGEQLEIDISWNSARLSASRYSELEVRRLIKFGRATDVHDLLDTQSVLNQRDALRFLLGRPGELDLDRVTLCNLHAILAHNLLPDESAAGRLRKVDERSRHRRSSSSEASGASMETTFQQMIEVAQAIADPFERAFFAFVQIPYLAPFTEMNDRVARFAVNIPLIAANLAPFAFVELPADVYADALRGVIERSRIDLLKDLFLWGYERSAQRYGAGVLARSTPDPFRLERDGELRAAVAEVIRLRLPREAVPSHLDGWVGARVGPEARDRFLRIVDMELRGLHEGNYARYPVAASDFRAWQAVWSRDCTDIHGLV